MVPPGRASPAGAPAAASPAPRGRAGTAPTPSAAAPTRAIAARLVEKREDITVNMIRKDNLTIKSQEKGGKGF